MTLLVETLDIPCGGDWLNTLFRSRLTFKNVVLQSNLESADSNQKFEFQNIQHGIYARLDSIGGSRVESTVIFCLKFRLHFM